MKKLITANELEQVLKAFGVTTETGETVDYISLNLFSNVDTKEKAEAVVLRLCLLFEQNPEHIVHYQLEDGKTGIMRVEPNPYVTLSVAYETEEGETK